MIPRYLLRYRVWLHTVLWSGVLLGFCSCAPVTLPFDDPSLQPLVPVAEVSSANLLVWSPDGSRVAVDDRGLVLIEADSGQSRRVSDKSPRIVAWGMPGLALAYPLGEKTSLQLQREPGTKVEQLEVDGFVTAMTWSRSGVLYALVNRHTYYRFGLNQRTLLLSWQPGQEPSWQQLADVTLDRSTPSLVGEAFPLGPQLELSPLEDEILYSRLHDPPAFAAEYRVFVRHLATGRERLLARQGLQGGAAHLLPDGETALLTGEGGALEKKLLWDGGQERLPQRVSSFLEVAGELMWVDGAVYRGAEKLWQLQQPLSARFSPDGSRLAVLGQGHLYLVGVPTPIAVEETVVPSPELLKLRRLRALELISPAEYRRYREE